MYTGYIQIITFSRLLNHNLKFPWHLNHNIDFFVISKSQILILLFRDFWFFFMTFQSQFSWLKFCTNYNFSYRYFCLHNLEYMQYIRLIFSMTSMLQIINFFCNEHAYARTIQARKISPYSFWFVNLLKLYLHFGQES